MNEHSNTYVCIMAGGSGERFWPMSRRRTPKHLLKLFSERTLLEETVRRFEGVVPRANIFVLTNEAQLEPTRAALPMLAPDQIIAEPEKRDTAPAAALATGLVRARAKDGVMALLPADHLIKNTARLAEQLGAALARAAGTDALLTFAIKPSYPSPGFGYLEMGEELDRTPTLGVVRRAVRFVEKPDLPTAERYVAGGNHAWNAGMFIWRVSAFLDEAERHAPALAKFVREFPAGDPSAYLQARFGALPKTSVDYAVMEKAARVETILAEYDWDDVGMWTSLPPHLQQDAAGNAVKGAVLAENATRNIAISNGRVVALVGVKDLVVVETPDAVLVCHRDAVQDIKKLMPMLPKELQ
ncbi:mannose-1-phosphate guanylyltransferase [Opitutus terrae]|uniref:Mannose-1-phosphate guanylyltransferase (GDP) n=1 Tax=Opitutus terrae (strain DSM 11246 / JCM 15787 / PB90-1) TaxID=452637 RepID=B1ZYI3_OPITP|nr:sugar phosphate nucleotidyltransferase [Opitutus terrae]ACB77081.1 Mannose-1-phosphate guanylyltransferase (GDP) [Opitutus terrae PB90-1]